MILNGRRSIGILTALIIIAGLVHVWQHDVHLEKSHNFENCLLSHLGKTVDLTPFILEVSITLILAVYFISRLVPFQRHLIFAKRAPPSFF
jgi:hypothetical protein